MQKWQEISHRNNILLDKRHADQGDHLEESQSLLQFCGAPKQMTHWRDNGLVHPQNCECETLWL